MSSEHVDFQLAPPPPPPHLHRRNAAERAIAPSRTTLLLVSAPLTRIFPCIFGTASSHRPSLPSIFFVAPASIPSCPPTHNFTVPLNTTAPRSLLLALAS
jgi:hypothetical protein